MTTLFKNLTLLTALSLSLIFGLSRLRPERTVGATTGAAAVGGYKTGRYNRRATL